ncbi:hypothetical protein XENTR_v10000721 [Xenopus tropicalis]|nr:hypothetical protein XENTR_v10000721 [Xenopus tropicalis]
MKTFGAPNLFVYQMMSTIMWRAQCHVLCVILLLRKIENMNYNSGFSCPEVQNPAFIEHQCQPTWNMSAPVPPAPPQDPPPPHAQHLGASKLCESFCSK